MTMNNYQEIINSYYEKLDLKKQKQLNPKLLLRLNEKILQHDNEDIEILLKETVDFLKSASDGDKTSVTNYKKHFSKLTKIVRKTYGYVAKGTIVGEYMAMGIALGVAFGAAFIAINPALMVIGLPIGIALGLSLGQNKEKEAEKDDLLY
jgi:hypothetical protein